MIDRIRNLTALGGVALVLAGATASAQEANGLPEVQYPDLMAGTLGAAGDVESNIAEAALTPRSGFRFESNMDGWEEAKRRFRERTGITFGGSYGILWQNFSDPAPGVERNAVGHKLTLSFAKEILNAGTSEAMTLEILLEDRRPLGTDLAPLQGGLAAGSIVPTAATWGDFDLGVTQFYVRQNLFNNRFQYTIGKIFAPNFVNAYPFFDDNRQFFSQTFSTSTTIASPLRGFGAVAAWYPTEGGLYLQGGIYTANSQDTGSTIGSIFDESEFFYHADIGWSGLARTDVPINARGPMDRDNFHITVWHKDAQPDAAPTHQPEAHGVAFNANFMASDNLMWFLRGGASDGWVSDRNLSAGVGYRPAEALSDLFGAGIGWNRPSNTALREQTTFEMFYRYHVTPNFALTPSIQVIFNPSLNPQEDTLVAAGLRARLTF